MNKKKFTAFMAVLALSALAACGRTKETANMDETEGYEASSDLLINTLEYLLNDGKETAADEEVTDEDMDISQDEEETSDQIEVTIYYGNGASEKLNTEVSAMDELTAENLISELTRHNIVPLGTKVNSFEEAEGNRGKALRLDLDKAFREYLKTMTSESEGIILASITVTFLEAYDAESIAITVDGNVLETNHAVYEEPFRIAQEYIDLPSQSD